MVYGDLQLFDIIIFIAIAVFLIYRLRNVLGKRTGFEGPKIITETKTKKTENNKNFAPQLKDNESKLSVAYKALEYAKKEKFDYLLIDTAGRLQNKKDLMDELKKITNVLRKIDSSSPHEIFLILDATTGQSAINQVEEFKKISPITGIIMTKLDSTAKGGILLAIGKKFKIPIIALGMGEKEDDLQMFNAQHYADAIIIN